MDVADSTELSLTDVCIWILESYKNRQDLTSNTEDERYNYQAQITKLSDELEQSMQETSKYKQLFQEQRLEVQKYQETVKKAVNDAYQKGLMNGNKQQ